jgi:hypothetical protein
MRIIRIAARILIGTVFLFSAVVKAIDPLGTAYKFHDYFHAFNLSYLNSISLILSILLCTSEFISGFAVLTGIRQRFGIMLAALLMIIFTPVTLVLALTNPVSDCGCFGDAVHLTNWQTFGKNIILLGAVAVLLFSMNKIRELFSRVTEWSLLLLSVLLFVLFAAYNLKYLPVIDFLPYKTGVRIADKMIIPEGATPDIYETTFIYEKNGVRKEFTLKDYPANDSTWKFVDQKSVIVKKGYKPPIHDFSITSPDGSDLTSRILESKGYTLLMISKKFEETSDAKLRKGMELGSYCASLGFDFYVLTASGSEEAGKYSGQAVICSADETTLKTMIRSNPGFMLIRDGTIIGKWSSSGSPGKEWFSRLAK